MAALSDLFTGTDGDLLENHTADSGEAWSKHANFTSGSMDIRTNRVRCVTATALYHSAWTPPSADYYVETPLFVHTLTASDTPGPAGRIDTAATTFYHARYNDAVDAWQLFKFVTGTATQLGADAAVTLTAGNTYTLRLEMEGDQIRLKVDGVLTIGPITDTAITAAGKAGVRDGIADTTTTRLHFASITADALVAAPAGPPIGSLALLGIGR